MRKVTDIPFRETEEGLISVSMPANSEILGIVLRDGEPLMRVIADTAQPIVRRLFFTVLAEQEFSGGGRYIDTWIESQFKITLHLFEEST